MKNNANTACIKTKNKPPGGNLDVNESIQEFKFLIVSLKTEVYNCITVPSKKMQLYIINVAR